MTTIPNHSVRELGCMRFRLRDELIFTPQMTAGEPYYLVEDPLNSRFFRLGLAEYAFVSLLDGRNSLQEARSLLSDVMPHHSLTEQDCGGICRWLVQMDLAQTEDSSTASRLARRAQSAEQLQSLSRWNPLAFRLPFGRPERLLSRLSVWVGWMHSPRAFVAWFALLAAGAWVVISDWGRFTASSQCVFAQNNWLWLAVCWAILKVLHEASHGLVCQRYGGSVREAGVLFVWFAPLAYVDVTSSWRFRRRRERMHVAAAGVYIEMLIAAVAALLWSNTSPGWINNLCFNTVFMASVSTVVFNLNPLMKFDGYYVLCDALTLPNLATNGRQWLIDWAKRYMLGVHSLRPDRSLREKWLVPVYGMMAMVWRVFVAVGLTITATTLFHGAGIALAFAALVVSVGLPSYRLARYLLSGKPGERPRLRQFALTAGSAAAVAGLLLGVVPWPGTRTAPAVVEYSPYTVVRASIAGFVREIHVQSGQRVEEGQLLVVLENRELAREIADLELQIRQSVIRSRRHEQRSETAKEQAESTMREALTTQLTEKRIQFEQLNLRAPHAGSVVSRNLAAIIDKHFVEGDEILALGAESQKELRVSLSQEDLEAFSSLGGGQVRIDLPHHVLWKSRVTKVNPRATLVPTHPALATTHGGPLPVRPVNRRGEKSAAEEQELLAPCFTAIAPLTESESSQLRSGQLATIIYRPCHESIGEHLHHAVSKWIQAHAEQHAQ